MSELEQEQAPDFEPAEPIEPDESSPDETDEEEADAEQEPAEHVEQPEPQGLTDKEIEQRFDRLEKEKQRHANRVGEILAEDANDLHECPLCAHFIPGFVYPQPAPEEIVAKVRPYIGLPDLSQVKSATHTAKCQDCDGLGVVQSGSLVRENAVIGCPTCNRSGYVLVSTGKGETAAAAPTNGTHEPPLFDGVNPDDPAVSELRSRGFTVIPPIVPAGS